jgi:hypothetical protein
VRASQWFGCLHVLSGPRAESMGPVFASATRVPNIPSSHASLSSPHQVSHAATVRLSNLNRDIDTAKPAGINLPDRCADACSVAVGDCARDPVCIRIKVRTRLSLDLVALRGINSWTAPLRPLSVDLADPASTVHTTSPYRRILASLDPASVLLQRSRLIPFHCRMRGSFFLEGIAMCAPDKVGIRGGVEDFTRNAWLSQALINNSLATWK